MPLGWAQGLQPCAGIGNVAPKARLQSLTEQHDPGCRLGFTFKNDNIVQIQNREGFILGKDTQGRATEQQERKRRRQMSSLGHGKTGWALDQFAVSDILNVSWRDLTLPIECLTLDGVDATYMDFGLLAE